jgi:large subunit ribosomal protein L21
MAAKVLNHGKGDKVLVFKKKRRKGYQKMNGHRQYLTELWIEAILGKGEKFDASKSTAPAPKAVKWPSRKRRPWPPRRRHPPKPLPRRPLPKKAAPKKAAAKKAAPKKDDK